MTRDRCHLGKKMMGRGADGGCGAEEKSCPVARVPNRVTLTHTQTHEEKLSTVDIDYYSQAQKALCERSPFDVAEETAAPYVPTLPSRLGSFLSRHTGGKKRQRKSDSGADKKSSRQGERSRGSNIWVETEEYFRDLTLSDVDTLRAASSFSGLVFRKCFSIPSSGNDSEANVVGSDNVSDEITDGAIVKDEVEDDRLGSDVSMVEASGSPLGDKGCSNLDSSPGLEWILGCRNKVSLTSERPSKKRKLLGGDAGLEKVLIVSPCDGNSSLCHFCSKGDTYKGVNPLVTCSCCYAVVHYKCYGIREKVNGSWSCSWCKKKDKTNDSTKPCLLCPKQGGALKPVHKNVDSGFSVEFAHLFCSQWMPEVFIEDLTQMEPVMNLGGVKETRKKLVCNICKVKYGACLRCSHGTCRTSFHPICAREARNRMEVWAKYGCDNVELRAFCSKHSESQYCRSSGRFQVPSEAVNSGSHVVNHLPMTLSVNRPQKLVGRRNIDNLLLCKDASDSNPGKLDDGKLEDKGSAYPSLNADSDCVDTHKCTVQGVEDVNPLDSLKFATIMKKLIDQGKVNVKDVASEINIHPDLLCAKLTVMPAENLVPDLKVKIVRWLRNHAYIGTLQKNLRVKLKSAALPKAVVGAANCSNSSSVPDSDDSNLVTDKMVIPQRKAKNTISLLKNDEIKSSSEEIVGGHGLAVQSGILDQKACEEQADSNKECIQDTGEKPLNEHDSSQDSPSRNFPNYVEGDHLEAPISGHYSSISAVHGKASESPDSYCHPYVQEKMAHMLDGKLLGNFIVGSSDVLEGEMSRWQASSNVSVCCDHQHQYLECNDVSCKSGGFNRTQQMNKKISGIIKLSPEDEIEGEIIFYQHRLLANAVSRKRFTDHLICNVVKSLPKEIDEARSTRWDAVLINQYFSELREAKKQGKKERRHKEAQAVLAAATAAAAASSRMSSFRKDVYEESTHRELMPRAKETLTKVALPKASLESDFCKEHVRSCDICRRQETILKPILVCSSCKVAVHLDCYRTVKASSGPWCCELCEELSLSRGSGVPAVNLVEKSYFVAECGLCGGTTGAFRKSSDGQWVHAFCAEWVFESTFKRGQANPVGGMETVSKGMDSCYICHRKYGVCLKCNYGHCQSAFHPSCARNAGCYMTVKTSGGKLQHRAYCEKHSTEQTAKAENKTHGIEELNRVKQIRVELERLRLLCERIIKREKIKRDLVLCSHDVLAFKRDHVARSVLVQTPFFLPEVSSESATTSLKGHVEDLKSCSEAVQRSDDLTVDSTVFSKHWNKVPMSLDTEQKTDDDSSTSQNPFPQKFADRGQFAGKQIPQRSLTTTSSRNLVDVGGLKFKSRKHAETFQKELVMTSDQASMKNSLLPKQYLYVPADVLAKEKQVNQETGSAETPKCER
ncbi:uncharacterized protein LOC111781857 isoform X1 [Cucurbita pepo subsp. pepo]|uniref:uncharacterized protein LOC111781857 isoform X1 n=1 Tax=Cucurbita pepo subsp. pepo TaxID=3664 RepID=UPI000C9D7C95|nr:uncharacterized protein LOC111781857 isoform X1 [Cucurbita pepo subsp. pepo]